MSAARSCHQAPGIARISSVDRADALARERGVVLHRHEACESDAMAGSRDSTRSTAPGDRPPPVGGTAATHQRAAENASRLKPGSSPSAEFALTLPTIGAIANPCPLSPVAIVNPSIAGAGPSTGSMSGVMSM